MSSQVPPCAACVRKPKTRYTVEIRAKEITPMGVSGSISETRSIFLREFKRIPCGMRRLLKLS